MPLEVAFWLVLSAGLVLGVLGEVARRRDMAAAKRQGPEAVRAAERRWSY